MSPRIDWPHIEALWTASGRTPRTVGAYLYWGRRFEAYWLERGCDPVAHLTLERVRAIDASGLRRRAGSNGTRRDLLAAGRALSCALAALGHRVPKWSPARCARRLPRIVDDFVRHHSRHRGVAEATSVINARSATAFVEFAAARRRNLRTIRITDVDAFVVSRSKTCVAKTVARICCAIRGFLRYLHMVGLLRVDLAAHVIAPRLRAVDRPRRALPWSDVRRILRSIDATTRLGLRDKALFLMMATYGMGAAEVTGIRLDDIDWRSRRLRLRRPKTGVATELPLLAPVAQVLAAYLRRSRPHHAATRCVFVGFRLPHAPLDAAALCQRISRYAQRAGIRDCFLGSHLFRHSHATRQIEQGTSAKVLGDILGHRRPESTSVYTRSAVLRLRAIALPVPR